MNVLRNWRYNTSRRLSIEFYVKTRRTAGWWNHHYLLRCLHMLHLSHLYLIVRDIRYSKLLLPKLVNPLNHTPPIARPTGLIMRRRRMLSHNIHKLALINHIGAIYRIRLNICYCLMTIMKMIWSYKCVGGIDLRTWVNDLAFGWIDVVVLAVGNIHLGGHYYVWILIHFK